jgi:hypothetical protein
LGAKTPSTVGLYGVVAHAVSGPAREIGIRTARGARRPDVRGLVRLQRAKRGGLGIATRRRRRRRADPPLASQLGGAGPTDPATFRRVSRASFPVALMASRLAAHRAAGVDPVRAPRETEAQALVGGPGSRIVTQSVRVRSHSWIWRP